MRKDTLLCIFCQSSATQLIIPTRKIICWVRSCDFLLRKRKASWESNWELQFIFILTMRKQAWLSLVVDLCCSWITDLKVSAIYIKYYSHKLSCIEWEKHILLFIKHLCMSKVLATLITIVWMPIHSKENVPFWVIHLIAAAPEAVGCPWTEFELHKSWDFGTCKSHSKASLAVRLWAQQWMCAVPWEVCV